MTKGWSRSGGWESYEAWRRWYLRVWGRVDEPRQYRPSVPLLGLYRVLCAPEGVQTEVVVAAVDPTAAAAAEREIRRRARGFFVKLQERIAARVAEGSSCLSVPSPGQCLTVRSAQPAVAV